MPKPIDWRRLQGVLAKLDRGAGEVLVLTARDVSSAEREQLHEAAGILRKGEAGLQEFSDEVQRLARS